MFTLRSADLKVIRVPGVLQRFGLTYLVTSLAYLTVAKRTSAVSSVLFENVCLGN